MLQAKKADGDGVKIIFSFRILTAYAAAVLILVMLPALAATQQPTARPTSEAKHIKKLRQPEERRVIPITINKGETYTISGLEKGTRTDSKAVANPNALSVQPQPSGDIVLLGTEGGSWKINATLANGEKVTYDVKVNAEAPPINSLQPGNAPTAIAP